MVGVEGPPGNQPPDVDKGMRCDWWGVYCYGWGTSRLIHTTRKSCYTHTQQYILGMHTIHTGLQVFSHILHTPRCFHTYYIHPGVFTHTTYTQVFSHILHTPRCFHTYYIHPGVFTHTTYTQVCSGSAIIMDSSTLDHCTS